MSTCYAVAVSFVQKFFWNALNAKDVVKFNKFLVLYMAILTLGPVFMVLFDWAKSRVALAWREALTKAYLGDYIRDQRFYKLQLTSNVDNTDQRIADDIAAFCDKAVAFFCTAFVSVCDLAVFSVILYKIFPPLYGTLLLYAAVGTSVTRPPPARCPLHPDEPLPQPPAALLTRLLGARALQPSSARRSSG